MYIYGARRLSVCLSFPHGRAASRTQWLMAKQSTHQSKQVAALHGHGWTRRALDAMTASSSSWNDDDDDWEPPAPIPADPSNVIKPIQQGASGASSSFRIRLRVAGGRELVYDGGEIEGLELLEGPPHQAVC